MMTSYNIVFDNKESAENQCFVFNDMRQDIQIINDFFFRVKHTQEVCVNVLLL